MEKITGIDVQEHEKSKRILNIRLNDEIIEKLILIILFDLSCSVISIPLIFCILNFKLPYSINQF